MPLVIVESAAKGKKIQSYLGPHFDVAASFGHVSDLPPRDLGVQPPDFQPTYEITEKGRPVIANLKKLVSKHNGDVYLATDLDREGEAIAWHLSRILGLKEIKRVVFPEITKSAVLHGIKNARPIDINTVRGQESRRVLDRFVGYLPTLSIYAKFGSGNSAGRVQSIGLRLVYERDLAIENFVSIEHYNVFAGFEKDGFKFTAEWQHPFKKNALNKESDHGEESKSKYLTNKAAAEKMKAAIISAPDFGITSIDVKDTTESPPCPFTTILMQQAAAKKFGWSAKKTMEVAQHLYEEGLITYHRTDSKDLSEESIAQIREFIAAFQAAKGMSGLLPEKPNVFPGAKNAQEAHEAIRPSSISFEGEGLSDDAKKLYGLIRTRTITSQMAHARHQLTCVMLNHEATKQPFKINGKRTTFNGWRIFINFVGIDTDEEEALNKLPDFNQSSILTASGAELKTSITKPPSKMKESELIKILDRKGIGRPSTMATICETNLKRGYIEIDGSYIITTKAGRAMCAWLMQHFTFMNYDYSAQMEEGIDQVMQAKQSYKQFVSAVYNTVNAEVRQVNKSDSGINTDEGGNIIRREYETRECMTCKKNTLTKYPQKKDKSKFVWGCSDRSCKQPLMNDLGGVPVDFAKKTA